jgi:monoamine oxidase
MSELDVIIVGAGLSGLYAARCLTQAGVSVQVLEARDRVGGRTQSERIGNARLDVGGQWVGPTQDRVLALSDELHVARFPTYNEGTKIIEIDGRKKTYSGDIPSLGLLNLIQLDRLIKRINRLANTLPIGRPYDAQDALEWDRMSVAAFQQKHLFGRGVKGMVDVLINAIFSAEPHEISLLFLLHYVRSAGTLERLVQVQDGAQQERFVYGAQTLSERMAEDLEGHIVLSAPVSRIDEKVDGVVVYNDARVFEARYVILALPPVLTGNIRFVPPMPPLRDQLIQRMPMGYTIKCLILYDRTFWRNKGYAGEALSNSATVSFVYDNSAHNDKQPGLVAFITGDRARYWGEQSAPDRKAAVLKDLVRFFGPIAGKPVGYVEKNWNQEPWSGGCPVGLGTPGALTGSGTALREPVGRIHWAGTETATRWCGFMDGALEAGERAANEVLERLR